MGQLNKHGFKNSKPRLKRLDLPEFGEDAHAFIRDVPARELQCLRDGVKAMSADNAFFDLEYSLLSKVLVDADGNPLFKDAAEMRELTEFTVEQLQRLATAAMEWLGLSKKN